MKRGAWSDDDIGLLVEAVRCGIPLTFLPPILERRFDSIRFKYRQLRKAGECDEASGRWQNRLGRLWPEPTDPRLAEVWKYAMLRYSTDTTERIEDMRSDPLSLFAAIVVAPPAQLADNPGLPPVVEARHYSAGLSDSNTELSVTL